MKCTIEIDATPKEMRALLGLPEVETLQQEMLDKVREKLLARIDSDAPEEVMKLFIPIGDQYESMQALQASFWQAFGKGLDPGNRKDKK